MIFADGAFQAGQLFGVLILVLVVVGVVRLFARSDVSWREKVFGKKRDR
jgi:hypothetical protein